MFRFRGTWATAALQDRDKETQANSHQHHDEHGQIHGRRQRRHEQKAAHSGVAQLQRSRQTAQVEQYGQEYSSQQETDDQLASRLGTHVGLSLFPVHVVPLILLTCRARMNALFPSPCRREPGQEVASNGWVSATLTPTQRARDDGILPLSAYRMAASVHEGW